MLDSKGSFTSLEDENFNFFVIRIWAVGKWLCKHYG
jgi:hypothetical protein